MKLLGSLIAALGLSLSMLVAVPSTANAAYPGSVATTCNYLAPDSVRRHRPVVVFYRAHAAGNARPSGTAYFRVYRIVRGNLVKVRSLSNAYTGPRFRAKSLGSFRPGRYATQFVFSPNRGSVYKPCASVFRSFRVRR